MKRVFDLFVSFTGLLLLLPLWLVLGLAIKLYDGGPILFRQRRVGQNGVPFSIFKYRSMIVDADKVGRAITVGRDPRITPLGNFLRRYKLDELPQLLNVFLGQMSFVGPRPEVEEYVELYSETQKAVLSLKPGITDPASFAFFNESEILATAQDPQKFYVEKLMPEKIRINLEYAQQAGMFSDVFLIVATLAHAFGLKLDVFARLHLRAPDLGFTK